MRGLHVAQGDGECVGSVGRLGGFTHAEECAYHRLHLLFARMSVPCHRGLDLAWGIAAYRNTALRGRKQHYAANLSEPQGCFDVLSSENRFDCDSVRPKFLDQFGE